MLGQIKVPVSSDTFRVLPFPALPFPAHLHLLAQQLHTFILSPSSSHKACTGTWPSLDGLVCWYMGIN